MLPLPFGKSMFCEICSVPTFEYHFGVASCRACAAFFRRYVNSPNPMTACNCEKDRMPCRFCRMEQCIKAGMQKSKVQKKRDSNPCRSQTQSHAQTQMPSCSVQTTQIALRSNERIARAVGNYKLLGKERKIVHKMSVAKKVDFYEYTRVAMIDSRYVWKLLENTIFELGILDDKDKLNLFSNFFPKWTLFESAIMAFQRCDVKTFFAPNGKPAKQISKFYKDCMTVELRMKDAEVLQIFEPYWQSYYVHVAYPLFELKFDHMEHMAILAMMLLDPGYTNISEECSEMCYALRKIIQKELKGYYLERNLPEERLFKTMEALMLMEKADRWFQEEVHVCGVYNVSIDDEFRRMVEAQKI